MAVALVLLFLVVPILEIYLIIQVGQVIGGWQTLGLLVVESLIGGWIVRREGRRAWRALRGTFGAGRIPDRELADGALVLVGGTLLLTPGFLTDLVGFFFVLPFTRPLARRVLTRWLGRRAVRSVSTRFSAFAPGAGRRVVPGEVVPGQVVDEDAADPVHPANPLRRARRPDPDERRPGAGAP